MNKNRKLKNRKSTARQQSPLENYLKEKLIPKVVAELVIKALDYILSTFFPF